MATVNLHPSSTVSNDWNTVYPSAPLGSAHGNLADSGDLTYISTPDQNDTCILQLDDYTSGGTITSIRFYIRGVKFNTRGGDTDIQVKIENSGGTALYSENVTLNFTSGYAPEDHYGTARTTSDGSSAWTDSDLDGLRLNINTSPEDPDLVSQARVFKANIEVTYTPDGYGNEVIGVSSIEEVNGTANVEEVIGV